MSFPSYPDRNPTGNPALPVVPSHWEIRRLAHCGTFLKGSGGSKEDIVDDGLPCVRYGDLYTTHSFFIEQSRTKVAREVASEYTPIHYGDVLFAASGETFEEIGKSAVNLIHGDALCGGDVVILRPSISADARFLAYAADSQHAAAQKASMGRGTTVKHIYPDQLKQVVIALPPKEDQRAIAAFLDRETAKIDALVAEQERLIELLKEKRQAIISHAVTKGLNPNVPMKNSGIEWLGEIPAHWRMGRVKNYFRTCSGSTPDTSKQELYYSGPEAGIPWVRTTDLQNDILRGVEVYITDRALADTACSILPPGTVMVAMYGGDGTIGKNGLLAIPAAINQAVCGLLPATTHVSEYTFRFVQFYRPHWMIGAESSRKDPNISQERVRNAPILMPPYEEQKAIVVCLKVRLQQIDTLTSETNRAIDLLQERRTAMVSAAVTGQIDVRGLANPEAA